MKGENQANSQMFAMSLVEWFSPEKQQGWISAEAADSYLCRDQTWQSAGFECLFEVQTPFDVFTYVRRVSTVAIAEE